MPKNHLEGERSLYLRMHADNPVDWYPWNYAALEKAEKQDRPIFLSVGYSACHWCHVMAKESFEDDNVASILNRSYVSIKVDREERPDLDSIYMAACQLITGSGGWPLNLILTPDLKPFFAASYIPRSRSPAGPGLVDILTDLESAWRSDRAALVEFSEKAYDALREFASRRGRETVPADISTRALRALSDSFDQEYGGFDVAPKFPSTHKILLLLRLYETKGDRSALAMATKTLDAMRAGGIYDHIGSGFHRYSTDRSWHLPHFEKMLYDQAMHLLAYSEAFKVTREERFRATALDLIGFVEREMTSPSGGFYSAMGADSEGEEGRYYLWSLDEITKVLGTGAARVVIEAFDVTREGNYWDEATGRKDGRNILHQVRSVDELSGSWDVPAGDIDKNLRDALRELGEVRRRRERPDLDDKVLTEWNGMMIAALARAGTLLGVSDPLETAHRALDDLMKKASIGIELKHRTVGDEATVDAMLDDYACLAWGMVELSSYDPDVLPTARKVVETMVEKFHDPRSGAFYQTTPNARHMIVRMCEGYDGASPSGNSIAAYVLARLSSITGENGYANTARGVAEAFADDLRDNPAAHAFMVLALEEMNRS
ncbi:MAG TPA: thioredoxin domain-containing protein [Methanomassiliicoccales archaeon]|nr:thioredoxin domain-containing protein [Methanomassiliicoccales archaeon]